MKNTLVILFILVLQVAHAQLTLNASVTGGYNFSNSFSAFRDVYNETNKDDLKNNLGNVALFKGITMELNYRVLGLTSGVTRTYMQAGTSAKFNNGAKRMVDYTYKLTNAFIGGGFNLGEKTEIRIEVGMVHSVSSIYSKVKLPTGEIDYNLGGISHQSTWTNIGLSGRLSFIQYLGEKFSVYGTAVFNRIMADNTDIAPYINYFDTKVTHTFQGVLVNIGIGYQIAPKIS